MSAPIRYGWCGVVFYSACVEERRCSDNNTGLAVTMSADLSQPQPTQHRSVFVCVGLFPRSGSRAVRPTAEFTRRRVAPTAIVREIRQHETNSPTATPD